MTIPKPSKPSGQTATAAMPESSGCPVRSRWVRRVGAAGFMFFFIKGLLWLTVPAALAIWRGCAAS